MDRSKAQAIVRQLRSHSPWRTKHVSENVEEIRDYLKFALLLGKREDYCIVLGRLLQHFPARNNERDAVILSDLAADCFERKVSLCGFIFACDDIRTSGSSDNPFLPPSGEILRQAINKTKDLKLKLEELCRPVIPRLPKPAQPLSKPHVSWACKYWQDFTENDKSGLRQHLKAMDTPQRSEYAQYLKTTVGVPTNFFQDRSD